MDLTSRNDVIIDKMACLCGGFDTFSFVVTKLNFVCTFLDMKSLNNEGKMLFIVMWHSEIIHQTKPDLGFDMDTKLCTLVRKYMPHLALHCSIKTIS